MPSPTTSAPQRVSYDCTKCPGYCCSIYERVTVTKRDLARIARHYELSLDAARARFTKPYGEEMVLRRRNDEVLGRACKFLDPVKRSCTIYEARPTVCREYPGRPKCAYFEVIEFERETQEDPHVLPLIQVTFRKYRDEE